MPDLILLDLGLPVLDGWEAARLLKAETNDTRAIPIIALSAHAMAGDRAAALEAGCNDYGTKPVDFQAHARVRWQALLPSPGACP